MRLLFFALCCVAGVSAHAEAAADRVMENVSEFAEDDLVPQSQAVLKEGLVPKIPPARFNFREESVSLADTYCTSVVRVFPWSSYHPGYGHKVNQNQNGYGFKCRIGTKNPTIVELAGMTNSQRGATLAFGIGKQIDLVSVRGPLGSKLSYYVGGSINFLAYEWPSRQAMYFAWPVPLVHHGLALQLPRNLGVIGVEEERLPVDGIRLYKYYAKLTFEFR